MLKNVRILILLLAILIIAATSSKSAILADDPNVPDTIYVDSVVSTSMTRGYLPVYFYNDEELAGLEITLTYDAPDVLVDSFSFVDGRVNEFSMKGVYHYSGNTFTIYCFSLSDAMIAVGDGLLGEVHFSFAPGLDAQVVRIDTTTVTIGDREFSTSFSDWSSSQFQPSFVSGYLDIQLGSCCLGDRGNVNGSEDDIVDVSDLVYMVKWMFHEGPGPYCLEECNVDASNELVDVADLVYMVKWMFHEGPPPAACP